MLSDYDNPGPILDQFCLQKHSKAASSRLIRFGSAKFEEADPNDNETGQKEEDVRSAIQDFTIRIRACCRL